VQGSNDLPSGSGSYDFGSIAADGDGKAASGYATFTIQNTGTDRLSLSSVAVTGSDFDKTSPLSTTVNPSGSTTFTIRFDPLSEGSCQATVTIVSSDADEGYYTFQVAGIGTDPGVPEIDVTQGSIVVPSGTGYYAFSNVAVDGEGGANSAYVPFTIHNLGTAYLAITSVELIGSDFHEIDYAPIELAPNATTSFYVRFDPLSESNLSATVTIASDDADEGSYTFLVTGSGASGPPVPDINIRQGSTQLPNGSGLFHFENVMADGDNNATSAWVTFTIENLGTGYLHVSKYWLRYYDSYPPFDWENREAGDLAPGDSFTFDLRFDPETSGFQRGTIIIDNDDPDESQYSFDIDGTGI